jgi:hypothetical protein
MVDGYFLKMSLICSLMCKYLYMILTYFSGLVMLNLWLDSLKDRNGKPERGRGREPIKIPFKNSAYVPDFTRAPPEASLAKSTQPLKCYWT